MALLYVQLPPYHLQLHQAHKQRLRRLAQAAARVHQELELPRCVEEEPEFTHVPLPGHARHIRHIQDVVCAHFKVSVEEMQHGRKKLAAQARFLTMWFIKRRHNVTTSWLGTRFGGRDHTTAMNALRRVEQLRACDPEFAAAVADMELKIERT